MTGPDASTPDVGRLFDELLVTYVQSGDRRAAERLAIRWQPRLARTANRLLRDEDQAFAAVQETWISIIRGIGSLRDPSRFAPWAFGILRRRCADRIGHEVKRREREDSGVPDIGFTPEADRKLEIRQAFDALPRDQAFAAHLFYVEGFILAEIAEVQDVPAGTAKTRLFHARRKLKAALSDAHQGVEP